MLNNIRVILGPKISESDRILINLLCEKYAPNASIPHEEKASRVDTYVSCTSRYLESAVIGELGNNTFDHNLDYDGSHLRGSFFLIIILEILLFLQILEKEMVLNLFQKL